MKEGISFLISIGINLSVLAIWQIVEYVQYGELQWGRTCDSVVWIMYIFIIWALLMFVEKE